jgi:hypothetical protein
MGAGCVHNAPMLEEFLQTPHTNLIDSAVRKWKVFEGRRHSARRLSPPI